MIASFILFSLSATIVLEAEPKLTDIAFLYLSLVSIKLPITLWIPFNFGLESIFLTE